MKHAGNVNTRDFVPGVFAYLSIVILFVAIGYFLLSANIWDYDFWWHLATGRYIVETRSIPSTDPFSFTSQLSENSSLYPGREHFILSQYWLAQVIFYGLYQVFGFAGIGGLRAAIVLLTLYLIYSSLRRSGAMFYIAYIFTFVAFLGMLKFSGERPVLFTLLGSVLVFVAIDGYERERSGFFYLLPLVMLLWANLHGGFILGDAIIMVFVITEIMKVALKRSAYTTREKLSFFIVSAIAIGMSGLNPNGFFAFLIALSKEYLPFYAGIQEYQAPFRLYALKLSSLDYGYLIALFSAPVILLLRNRKFNPTRLVLLVCLGAASLSAVRFTSYYTLIACLVLGVELSLWLREHENKFVIDSRLLNVIFSVTMVVSSILYAVNFISFREFKIRESTLTTPKFAADFIQRNGLKGNMLNSYESGGYLAWRLYPDIKTFIDTRGLNYTVMREYSWIVTAANSIYRPVLPQNKRPLWKRLLEHYNINLIVFYPYDVYGNIPDMIFRLLEGDEWAPIYYDTVACIFVRDTTANREIIKKFRMTKDVFYNRLLIRAVRFAQSNKDNPIYMESIGDVFVKMGKKDEAIKAYEYAIKRLPQNDNVRAKLAKVKETEGKKDE